MDELAKTAKAEYDEFEAPYRAQYNEDMTPVHEAYDEAANNAAASMLVATESGWQAYLTKLTALGYSVDGLHRVIG